MTSGRRYTGWGVDPPSDADLRRVVVADEPEQPVQAVTAAPMGDGGGNSDRFRFPKKHLLQKSLRQPQPN